MKVIHSVVCLSLCLLLCSCAMQPHEAAKLYAVYAEEGEIDFDSAIWKAAPVHMLTPRNFSAFTREFHIRSGMTERVLESGSGMKKLFTCGVTQRIPIWPMSRRRIRLPCLQLRIRLRSFCINAVISATMRFLEVWEAGKHLTIFPGEAIFPCRATTIAGCRSFK